MCKRLHRMSKKATINDLAKELNITASTVSRALNDNPRISDDTKRLVKEAAKRLGYQVNGVASALRSGRTYIVGIIVPTADRNFFSSIVRGMEDVVNKAGYNVMICQSNDSYKSELDNINALVRAQVDGIALSVAKETLDYKHLALLKAKGIPLVLFDRVASEADISTVTIDDYGGAHKATKHLIDQGCKRIATLVARSQHINIYKERLRGYKDALIQHGIAVNNDYIRITDLMTVDGGVEATKALWELSEKPDAIFCQSDYAAIGAMQFLKQQGYEIPKDVALVGFANTPFTAFLEPSLTTVDQRPIEMGQTVAKLFLEQVETGENIIKNVTLDADLVVRQSSQFRK